MAMTEQNIKKKLRPTRIILPMLLGFAVIAYLFSKEYEPGSLSVIEISFLTVVWLVVSLLLMVLRDFGYIVRLRILSSGELSWRKCFNVIMLWEFTSNITPSGIGGTGIATYYIYKEGMSAGKSAAIVLATSFLDELYFALTLPILFILIEGKTLFVIGDAEATLNFTNKYFYFAIIGYSLKFMWVLIMAYAIFINPRSVRNLLFNIFKLPFLKRWQRKILKAGNEMVDASHRLRKKKLGFWLKTFISTALSWSSRYWVLNFLILAVAFGIPGQEFFISAAEHFLIFARQFVMWIMLLVMPTPGGSGFIEAVFSEYMAAFIPDEGLVPLMALLWRLVTYYPYLIIGVIIVPRWVRSKFKKHDIE